MGLLETRLIDFDAIIICDFNNSFIPKISLKDKFLSFLCKLSSSMFKCFSHSLGALLV